MRKKIRALVLAAMFALSMLALSASGALANHLCYSTGWYQEGPYWYRDTELYYEGGGRYVFREEKWITATNSQETSYFSCYK